MWGSGARVIEKIKHLLTLKGNQRYRQYFVNNTPYSALQVCERSSHFLILLYTFLFFNCRAEAKPGYQMYKNEEQI
jgi:hypothetical protein